MVKITKLMLNDMILESAVWEGLSSTEKEDNYVELPNQTSPPMMLCWKCNKVIPAAFAKEVSKYSYNAVNLDMGEFGYGWIGKNKHTRWARYNRDKQTSWICVE